MDRPTTPPTLDGGRVDIANIAQSMLHKGFGDELNAIICQFPDGKGFTDAELEKPINWRSHKVIEVLDGNHRIAALQRAIRCNLRTCLGLTLTDCSYSDKKTEKKTWETCYILDPRKKPSAEDLEAICRMHPLVISFPHLTGPRRC